ncbi:hypothetical protein Tco_0016374 [Tanacetum coccineum]
MVAFLSNTQGLFELANMFSSSSKNADGNNDVDRMGMEMGDRCFGELLQDTSVVEAKLSSRGSTSVTSMYQTLFCMSKLSSRGSVVLDSDGDSVAPCPLRRLATPEWLSLPPEGD